VGQKVHPIGFRLGVIKDWESQWYADKEYTTLLHEDIKLRKQIEEKIKKSLPEKQANAGLSRIEIKRSSNNIEITLFTAKPGIIIGKNGDRVDQLKADLEKETGRKVKINIEEIRQPELDAYLVAESIGEQISKRVNYKRAMKQAVTRAMRLGAKGIKIKCGGRLAGSEMARIQYEKEGRIPLQTIRADVDYGVFHAHTTYGRIGVKVWIYKGDVLPGQMKKTIPMPAVVSDEDLA
jgi:small subunit ribosomal protein S3